MKLQILSDLHREFYRQRYEPMDLPWRPSSKADVIVLAGDIDHGDEAAEWLAVESERLGMPIVYVPGNHEYYGSVLEDRLTAMRERLRGAGAHLLDGDEVVIEGVRFLGATLWTDYQASLCTAIPDINLAMFQAGRMINDHQQIRTQVGAEPPAPATEFTPQHARDLHRAARIWLTERLAVAHDGPTVVITHHGPCSLAQHRRYPVGELSGAYWSNLSDLFADVDLWVYGHTHAAVDTLIEPSGMRLVSNQAGYPHDTGVGFERVKLVEVESA
jgi:predicted phosphodiesterase